MIHGRRYEVGCADGQEDHLRMLAGVVNDKVEQMIRSVGTVEDARLMFMAALLLADELWEARQQMSGSDAVAPSPAGEGEEARVVLEAQLVDLAERIEAVAERLRGA